MFTAGVASKNTKGKSQNNASSNEVARPGTNADGKRPASNANEKARLLKAQDEHKTSSSGATSSTAPGQYTMVKKSNPSRLAASPGVEGNKISPASGSTSAAPMSAESLKTLYLVTPRSEWGLFHKKIPKASRKELAQFLRQKYIETTPEHGREPTIGGGASSSSSSIARAIPVGKSNAASANKMDLVDRDGKSKSTFAVPAASAGVAGTTSHDINISLVRKKKAKKQLKTRAQEQKEVRKKARKKKENEDIIPNGKTKKKKKKKDTKDQRLLVQKGKVKKHQSREQDASAKAEDKSAILKSAPLLLPSVQDHDKRLVGRARNKTSASVAKNKRQSFDAEDQVSNLAVIRGGPDVLFSLDLDRVLEKKRQKLTAAIKVPTARGAHKDLKGHQGLLGGDKNIKANSSFADPTTTDGAQLLLADGTHPSSSPVVLPAYLAGPRPEDAQLQELREYVRISLFVRGDDHFEFGIATKDFWKEVILTLVVDALCSFARVLLSSSCSFPLSPATNNSSNASATSKGNKRGDLDLELNLLPEAVDKMTSDKGGVDVNDGVLVDAQQQPGRSSSSWTSTLSGKKVKKLSKEEQELFWGAMFPEVLQKLSHFKKLFEAKTRDATMLAPKGEGENILLAEQKFLNDAIEREKRLKVEQEDEFLLQEEKLSDELERKEREKLLLFVGEQGKPSKDVEEEEGNGKIKQDQQGESEASTKQKTEFQQVREQLFPADRFAQRLKAEAERTEKFDRERYERFTDRRSELNKLKTKVAKVFASVRKELLQPFLMLLQDRLGCIVESVAREDQQRWMTEHAAQLQNAESIAAASALSSGGPLDQPVSAGASDAAPSSGTERKKQYEKVLQRLQKFDGMLMQQLRIGWSVESFLEQQEKKSAEAGEKNAAVEAARQAKAGSSMSITANKVEVAKNGKNKGRVFSGKQGDGAGGAAGKDEEKVGERRMDIKNASRAKDAAPATAVAGGATSKRKTSIEKSSSVAEPRGARALSSSSKVKPNSSDIPPTGTASLTTAQQLSTAQRPQLRTTAGMGSKSKGLKSAVPGGAVAEDRGESREGRRKGGNKGGISDASAAVVQKGENVRGPKAT
ncbi:unnamed protein product [Amoebophrya sp. A120]|nr:unnamed protein product [Amoebophrya sp. A120]|eukprot:GSA120T00006105001.1